MKVGLKLTVSASGYISQCEECLMVLKCAKVLNCLSRDVHGTGFAVLWWHGE